MNFIFALLVVSYVFYITKRVYLKSDSSQKVFLGLLLIVHYSLMCIAYKNTLEIPENDALGFYTKAVEADSWVSLFGLGSTFIAFLIYPLVKIGTSLFVLFLLFSTISYCAFLLFFEEMIKVKTTKLQVFGIPISQIFFLLPSLHFWSGMLGKDALVFFILSYLLFEFKKQARINFIHLFGLLMLLLLRPHIFAATFVALFIYIFTQKGVSKEFKIKLSILALAIVGILIPIIMSFLSISNLTFATISAVWKGFNWYALNSGSGNDLSESSYIGRIWLLLFRPLFYDANTTYQYYISVENSFVLLLSTIIGIGLFAIRKQLKIVKEVKMSFLIGICILLLISIYIYNLGLASRMRLMILPFLFYTLNQLYCSNSQQNDSV